MFLQKGVLEKCNKFTRKHPCWSVISIKLQRNSIRIKLRHGCSPVNLLHIFRTPFSKNSSGWQLLKNIYFALISWKTFELIQTLIQCLSYYCWTDFSHCSAGDFEQVSEVHLGPCQTSMIEISTVNYRNIYDRDEHSQLQKSLLKKSLTKNSNFCPL